MIAKSDIQWGTITELLAAVGGFAAVVVAAVTIWFNNKNIAREREENARQIAAEQALTREAIDVQRDRIKRDAEARERWQAEHVLCTRMETWHQGEPTQPQHGTIRFEVTNSGQSYLLELRPFYIHSAVTFRGPVHEAKSFAPSSSETLYSEYVQVSFVAEDKCGVTFRDTNGLYWAKYVDGLLLRLARDGGIHDQQLVDREMRSE
ncbi:MAG: hypothetical protein K8R99_11550 [Actinomycetia bacterium]|nr:hypothetical protein [Actinomycetes bacterium]